MVTASNSKLDILMGTVISFRTWDKRQRASHILAN